MFVYGMSKSRFPIPPFGPLRLLLFKNLHLQPRPQFRILPRLLIEPAVELAKTAAARETTRLS
jgi:hypothetical protein